MRKNGKTSVRLRIMISPNGTRSRRDELVFDSNRDGDEEVYVSSLDGSNQRRLTAADFELARRIDAIAYIDAFLPGDGVPALAESALKAVHALRVSVPEPREILLSGRGLAEPGLDLAEHGGGEDAAQQGAQHAVVVVLVAEARRRLEEGHGWRCASPCGTPRRRGGSRWRSRGRTR